MSYPPPAAQHQHQNSLPPSRSQDFYPRQQEYRPQPHPVQRQRTNDTYGYDEPSLMPYDIPDRSYPGSQQQQQSYQQRSISPVNQTQANAGHGWGEQGQANRRF